MEVTLATLQGKTKAATSEEKLPAKDHARAAVRKSLVLEPRLSH